MQEMGDLESMLFIANRQPVPRTLRDVARHLGCMFEVGQDREAGLKMLAQVCPAVVVVYASASEMEDLAYCRRLRTGQPHCGLVLLLPGISPKAEWPENGPDDVLLYGANLMEVRYRLKAALQLSQLRRANEGVRMELERQRCAQEREGTYLNDAATYLVEIAAELQSEVCHSAEREEKSVRVAQVDTIAQATATLRHEINNPLFAIMGSADSALRRLRKVQAQYPDCEEGLIPVITGIERIQKGGDRIQNVVQAISEMLGPAKRDYVEGVQMLDLSTVAKRAA